MASVHSSRIKSSGLDKQRRCEDHKDLLLRYLKDDWSATEHNSFLDRSDAYRRKRESDQRLAELSRKAETKQEKKSVELGREEDAWIAKTLEENDTGLKREKRVIHYLINKSPKLKELRRNLQKAEITRQRHQRRRQKQLFELDQTTRNACLHVAMEKQLAEEERKENERHQHQQLLQLARRGHLDHQNQGKGLEKKKEIDAKIQKYLKIGKTDKDYQQKLLELETQRDHIRANQKARSDIYQALKEQWKLQEEVNHEDFEHTMMETFSRERKLDQLREQDQKMEAEMYKYEVERLWKLKEDTFKAELKEAKKVKLKEEEEDAQREAAIEAEYQWLLSKHEKVHH